MICTVIENKNFREIIDLLENHPDIEMAEIRLDKCPMSNSEIQELFGYFDIPLIATCRAELGEEKEASDKLAEAIKSGARYVDLEVEAPAYIGINIKKLSTKHGTTLIRSWHNYDGTPNNEVLASMYIKCRNFGADIVKIATTAESEEDVDKILSFYDYVKEHFADSPLMDDRENLVAFAMGEKGQESRYRCLAQGSPFTYASLGGDLEGTAEKSQEKSQNESQEEDQKSSERGTAEKDQREDQKEAQKEDQKENQELEFNLGQIPYKEMKKRLYENMHFIQSKEPLRMPASKSFAQRAIIAAALAHGETKLGEYSPCRDTEAAIKVAETLGAKISVENVEIESEYDDSIRIEKELSIKGIGAWKKCLRIPELEVGESGLLARLAIPLAAVLSKVPTHIKGEGTLLKRPLRGAQNTMASFGVTLINEGKTAKPGFADAIIPLTVNGNLISGRADISGKEGSQIISGLLTALALADKRSTLFVHEPKSIPYMFITMEVLRRFGVEITNEMQGGDDFVDTGNWSLCTGMTFRVPGKSRFKATKFALEGDWSAAANFLVAGAIFGDIEIDGLDTSSLQADLSIMDILMEAGAGLAEYENGGLHTTRSPLRAFTVDTDNCPDLFPIVSVLAAFCPGVSHIYGISRLITKESNRAKAILEMLLQMGVEAEINGNEMVIRGHSLTSRLAGGNLLKGGKYTSSHDHRMVMALKVASLGADSEIIIDDEECVSKSYPEFISVFESLLN